MAGVTLWKADRLHDLLGEFDVVVIFIANRDRMPDGHPPLALIDKQKGY